MTSYKADVDYRLVIPEEQGVSVNVELLNGDYAGVIYTYGKVKAEEQDDKEQAYLSFEYELVDSNGFENLEENIEFKNHIGNILVSIMMSNFPEVENN